jgi:hypothetical protein
MKRLMIFLFLILTSCGITPPEPDNPDSKPVQEKIDVAAIYSLDQEVRNHHQEQETLRSQVLQAAKDNRLEDAKELQDKSNKLAKTINELEIRLDGSLENYHRQWDDQVWYEKFVIEAGPQYTHFDNDLEISDGFGVRLRLQRSDEELKRIHTYPLIPGRDAPLRKVVSSPFILELRSYQGETIVDERKQTATVNTALIGFGVDGEIKSDLYLGLSLMAGGQQYSNTYPEDVAPIISYSTGLKQYLSSNVSLSLSLSEDIIWTEATKANKETETFYNFSIAFLLRVRL